MTSQSSPHHDIRTKEGSEPTLGILRMHVRDGGHPSSDHDPDSLPLQKLRVP